VWEWEGCACSSRANHGLFREMKESEVEYPKYDKLNHQLVLLLMMP
jgi:hypothetical protein